MNFTVGEYFRFKWNDFELIAKCINIVDNEPVFEEEKSGLGFSLNQAGRPKIEKISPDLEALKNYTPDLQKFAPTFMGFRQKEKDD